MMDLLLLLHKDNTYNVIPTFREYIFSSRERKYVFLLPTLKTLFFEGWADLLVPSLRTGMHPLSVSQNCYW
jgi:hypothetical protein